MLYKTISITDLKQHIYKYTDIEKRTIHLIVTSLIEEIKDAIKRGDTVYLENFVKIHTHDCKCGDKIATKLRAKFNKEYRQRVLENLKDKYY